MTPQELAETIQRRRDAALGPGVSAGIVACLVQDSSTKRLDLHATLVEWMPRVRGLLQRHIAELPVVGREVAVDVLAQHTCREQAYGYELMSKLAGTALAEEFVALFPPDSSFHLVGAAGRDVAERFAFEGGVAASARDASRVGLLWFWSGNPGR